MKVESCQDLEFKRGETISLTVLYLENGQPKDLTGYTVTSQGKTGYPLASAGPSQAFNMVATLADQTTGKGMVTLSATADITAALKVAPFQVDVRYVDSLGNAKMSDTFTIQIVQEVTGLTSV
jgi:hypothetical protein